MALLILYWCLFLILLICIFKNLLTIFYKFSIKKRVFSLNLTQLSKYLHLKFFHLRSYSLVLLN